MDVLLFDFVFTKVILFYFVKTAGVIGLREGGDVRGRP